jgi:uncharacterized membrane protein
MPGFFRVFILWLHLLGVVVWVGGLVFQVLVIIPALKHLPVTAEWLQVHIRLERRIRYVTWPAVGIVLLTGLWNVMNVLYATSLAGRSLPAGFVRYLGLKLALVLLMLVMQGLQRFVLYPRLVAELVRCSSGATERHDRLLSLQHRAHLLHVLTVSAAVVVMFLGLWLRS